MLLLAESVNDRINRSVKQITDIENFGVAEYWTLPVGGRGDCEDFVLAKYKLLLDAGVDSRDLAVAVVLDKNRRNHAVLVLRHEAGDLVLDSLTSSILPWNRTGYTFLAMQADEDKSAWQAVMGQSPTSLVLAQR